MYNDLAGSAVCISCPAGYYCSDEGMTSPEICMLNSYCPEGSVEPTSCPEGTESNLVGSTTEADCLEIIDPINVSSEEDDTVVDLIEEQENEESADVETEEEPSAEEDAEASESQDDEE